MIPSIKVKRNVRKSVRSFWWIYLSLLCLGGGLFTQLGVTDSIPDVISLIVVIAGTAGVFAWILKNEPDGMAAFLMLCGYIVRLLYRYGTDSGKFTLAFSSAPSDASYFWQASSNLYWGKHNGIVSTKYPYLLRGFYEVFGNNRFLAEYINILFWVLASIILMKLSRKVELSGTRKYILYGIWVILPSSILIGTDLLRESIMVFFNMWSFYVFLEWMANGKKKLWIKAFLLVAPAAYLHTASIALWAAYLVIAAFWNTEKQGYRIKAKTIALLLVGLLGGWFFLYSPLRNIFGAYLGDLSLYGITHRPYLKGGSDYLQWMDCQNWLQFIPYTILRVFYFLFSPLPNEARGMIDLISFVTDGMLVFILLAYMVYKLKDRYKSRFVSAAIVCILALSGIFAWGVRNAGTAIRHRMLVWGILAMGCCVAMGDGKAICHMIYRKKDNSHMIHLHPDETLCQQVSK